MPPDNIQRQRQIFLEALEKEDPKERAAYLETVCANDPELQREIETLLAAEGGTPEAFLAPETAASPGIELPSHHAAALGEGTGSDLGHYTLLDKLGEGAFGTVYRAEQSEPVQREVALKIIKPGMDTAEVITRFSAERQALARMDHPSIAQVYDAGTTDLGRPYFVMELVRGVPLTEYCDEKKLSIQERLELFIEICLAVQHAHHKGVIHRDLKPSNILVVNVAELAKSSDDVAREKLESRSDRDSATARALPKVIDFGIAKATEQDLAGKTLLTADGQFMGTPQYMSPEQTGMSGTDVDTRADIYALGIILYELLTGSPPMRREDLKGASLSEIERVIREVDPPRPSQRIASLDDTAGIPLADARGADFTKFARRLRGDLDWIVIRALEKDRERRYETANAFAADVRRYLADEPVAATPPSAGYRAKKFARRHKGPLIGVAAVLVALAGGIGVNQWQAEHARVAKAQAERARGDTVDLTRFMVDDLSESLGEIGKLDILEKVASEVQSKFDGLAQDERTSEMKEAAVEAFSTLASVYEEKDQVEAAFKMAEKNYALLRELFEDDPSQEHALALAAGASFLGRLWSEKDEYEKSLSFIAEALAALETIPPAKRDTAEICDSFSTLYNRKCFVQKQMDELGSSYVPAAQAALRWSVKAVAADPNNFSRQYSVAANMTWCKWDGAEELFQELGIDEEVEGDYLALARKEVALDRGNFDTKHSVAQILYKYGEFHAGDHFEAERLAKELVAHDPANVTWRKTLVGIHESIGGEYDDSGQLEKARPYVVACLEWARGLVEAAPDDPGAQYDYADELSDYAHFLTRRGRAEDPETRAEARALFEKAETIFNSLIEHEPESQSLQEHVADLHFRKAEALETLEEKEASLKKNLEMRERILERDPDDLYDYFKVFEARRSLSELFLREGDLERAQLWIDRTRDHCDRILAFLKGAQSDFYDSGNFIHIQDTLAGRIGSTYRRKGRMHEQRGEHKEANAAYRERCRLYLEAFALAPSTGHWTVVNRTHEFFDGLNDVLRTSDPGSPETVEFISESMREFQPYLDNLDSTHRRYFGANVSRGRFLGQDGAWWLKAGDAGRWAKLHAEELAILESLEEKVDIDLYAKRYWEAVREKVGRMIGEVPVKESPHVSLAEPMLLRIVDSLRAESETEILAVLEARIRAADYLRRIELEENGFAASKKLLLEVIAAREKLAELKPHQLDNRAYLGGNLDALADRLKDDGRLDDAEALCRRALAVRRELAEIQSDNPTRAWSVASSLTQLARIQKLNGRLAEAEATFREGALKHESILAEHADRFPKGHFGALTNAWADLARVQGDRGNFDAAAASFAKAIEIEEQRRSREPGNHSLTNRIIDKWRSLASMMKSEKNDPAAALEAYERAVEVGRKLWRDTASPTYGRSLQGNLGSVAGLASEVGDRDKTIKAARERVAVAEQLLEMQPDNTGDAWHLSEAKEILARKLFWDGDDGEQEEAFEIWREALAIGDELQAAEKLNEDRIRGHAGHRFSYRKACTTRADELQLRAQAQLDGEAHDAYLQTVEGILEIRRTVAALERDAPEHANKLSDAYQKVVDARELTGDINGALKIADERTQYHRNGFPRNRQTPDLRFRFASALFHKSKLVENHRRSLRGTALDLRRRAVALGEGMAAAGTITKAQKEILATWKAGLAELEREPATR